MPVPACVLLPPAASSLRPSGFPWERCVCLRAFEVCVHGDRKARAGVNDAAAHIPPVRREQFREAACIAKVTRKVKGRASGSLDEPKDRVWLAWKSSGF